MEKSAKEKLRLIEWILAQKDSQVIDQLLAVVDDIEYDRVSDVKIVGHALNDLPITKSRFMHLVKQSLDGIDKGEYVTYADLESAVENW